MKHTFLHYFLKRKKRCAGGLATGLSLVEVVLSSAIFLLVVMGLSGVLIYGQETTAVGGALTRGTLLADEGLSALRNLRDSDWANLSYTSGSGLSTAGNQWSFSGSSDTTGPFTREVQIESLDASVNRSLVTSNISWQQTASRVGLTSLVTHFTNWRRSLSTAGDWSVLNLFNGALASPYPESGVRVQISGNYAYLVGSGTGTPQLRVYDISNPSNITLVGSTALLQQSSDLFVSEDGNYLYVTTLHPFYELAIYSISNPASPVFAGFSNLPTTQVGWPDERGSGVYVVGAHAYVTRPNINGDDTFFVIDVSNIGSPSLLGSVFIPGTPEGVVVLGNHAYVAVSGNTYELVVVDVTNPASPSIGYSFDMSGSGNAKAIATDGTQLFVGDGGLLRIVDISNPLSPSITGSFNTTGSEIFDIASEIAYSQNGNQYVFLSTNLPAYDLLSVNILNPSAPVLSGSYDDIVVVPFLGVTYSPDLDKVFVSVSSTTDGMRVFAPDPL